MPVRLWLDSLDGATCCSVAAKLWRAEEEGEKRRVECVRALDIVTGTIDQGVSVGDELGTQGASAT